MCRNIQAFKLKEKIIGRKKVGLVPTVLKDPDTNCDVTYPKKIKEILLSYCKKLLTNIPPKEDYLEDIESKIMLHEQRMAERISGGKGNTRSTQNRAQNAIITQVEGSRKDKGRSDPTSIEEKVHKRGGFQSPRQSSTTLTPKQSVPV